MRTGSKTITQANRILVVDSDSKLRGALCEQLVAGGRFEVHEAETAAYGHRFLSDGEFSFLVVSAALSDISGYEFCEQVRRLGIVVPIIFIAEELQELPSSLNVDEARIQFFKRPFRLAALVSSIEHCIMLTQQKDKEGFAIGPYIFKFTDKVLLLKKTPLVKVRLTEKEASILDYLCRAQKRVVPRDVLLAEVWGYSDGVTTHTLETHVYRIRKKIEADPSDAKLLITEPGGYRLRSQSIVLVD